jgi:hypothetical protein
VFVVFQEAKSALIYIIGYGIFLIAALIFELYRLRLRRRVPALSRKLEKKKEDLNKLILQQQKAEEQTEQARIIQSLEHTLEETKRKFKQNINRMN